MGRGGAAAWKGLSMRPCQPSTFFSNPRALPSPLCLLFCFCRMDEVSARLTATRQQLQHERELLLSFQRSAAQHLPSIQQDLQSMGKKTAGLTESMIALEGRLTALQQAKAKAQQEEWVAAQEAAAVARK